MPSRELVFGFECSGNRGPLNWLSSNGRWTGVPLRAVLERAGVQTEAREFVFFGADHGDEEVEFRGRTYTVDQQYGRSLERDQALSDEPLLAYALGGEPLTAHQGRPLRLLVPGWYGAPNVKFLSEIHVQKDQYLGKYQARHYRTLKGEMVNGEMKWKETAISTMRCHSSMASRGPWPAEPPINRPCTPASMSRRSWARDAPSSPNSRSSTGVITGTTTPVKVAALSIIRYIAAHPRVHADWHGTLQSRENLPPSEPDLRSFLDALFVRTGWRPGVEPLDIDDYLEEMKLVAG